MGPKEVSWTWNISAKYYKSGQSATRTSLSVGHYQPHTLSLKRPFCSSLLTLGEGATGDAYSE